MVDVATVIVGVLGQWASGKSTAAKTLVQHLGGEEEVIFITDRELLARQAVNHILNLDKSKIKHYLTANGMHRLDGELASVFLKPGEDLNRIDQIDLNMLLFDLDDAVYDQTPVNKLNWFDQLRLELGCEVLKQAATGKPIVIEAGYGTNTEPRGENPFSHTIADLFTRLEEAGVEPGVIKWIIIEATFETRLERNRKRPDRVPEIEFNRFAADGGDLEPDHQKQLEARGVAIKRVPNNHNDFNRFRNEILSAFNELYSSSWNISQELN